MKSFYIESLKVRNYRTLANVSFSFDSFTNVLIGENEAGKTSFVNVLRRFFDKNSSYQSLRFKEGDFSNKLLIDHQNNRNNYWQGHWIIATLILKFDEAEALKDISALELMDESVNGIEPSKGEVHFVFRPKDVIRKSLFELASESEVALRKAKITEYLQGLTIEDYEMKFYSKQLFNINSEEEYKKYVGDFEEMTFPNPTELSPILIQKEKLMELVDFTFIDYDRDRGLLGNSSPFHKSIWHKLNEIKENPTSWSAFKSILDSFNSGIDGIPEFENLSKEINASIESVIKSSFNASLSVRSNLTEDTHSIARSLNVVDKNSIDSGSFSLGILNILHISLVFLNASLERSRALAKGKTTSPIHILVIEEPESHLHVHLQKTLFSSIYDPDTPNPEYRIQVFMTTHSTHLSEATHLSRMNIIKSGTYENHYRWAKVYSPRDFISPTFDMEKMKRIERYLDVKRTELLFANGVVLVEGDAEQILIPTMFKRKFKVSLDELGVSLISVNSAVFEYVAELFGADRIQKNCSIITDLDRETLQEDEEDESFVDNTVEFTSLNNRLQALTRQYQTNQYVKIFVTQNTTFECDLAAYTENIPYFKRLVDKIYKNASSKAKVNQRLDDPKLAPNEVLRIANKVGKGWFALMLAEIIDDKFIVPEYVLKAIIFAAEESIRRSPIKLISSAGLESGTDLDINQQMLFDAVSSHIRS